MITHYGIQQSICPLSGDAAKTKLVRNWVPKARFSQFESYEYNIPEHLMLNIVEAPGPDGHTIEIYHLVKKDTNNRKASAAVLHVHGGG